MPQAERSPEEEANTAPTSTGPPGGLEEEYVLMDLEHSGLTENENRLIADGSFELSRLDTDTPVLILHSSREGVAAATLVGTYEDSIGTCVLFTEKLEEPVVEAESAAQDASPSGEEEPQEPQEPPPPKKRVQYKCQTEKVLKFRKVSSLAARVPSAYVPASTGTTT